MDLKYTTTAVGLRQRDRQVDKDKKENDIDRQTDNRNKTLNIYQMRLFVVERMLT